MNIVCFYFSGTGNTQWIVRRFEEESKHHMITFFTYAIEECTTFSPQQKKNVKDADYIALAYPIYGASIPPLFDRFLQTLHQSHILSPGQKAIILTTYGYINGYGPFCAKKRLKKLTLDVQYHINCRMMNNIFTPFMPISPLSEKRFSRRREQNFLKIKKLVKNIQEEKSRTIEGVAPYLIGGWIVRRLSGHKIRHAHTELSVDHSRCTRCLQCLKGCPTSSIEINSNTLAFTNSCTACMRCYNYCPQAAILYRKTYCDPKEFYRHRFLEQK